MKPTVEQFKTSNAAMLKGQRTADAAWAKGEYEAKGGDKAAYNFKPEFKGQSYEQQVRSKKNA